MNLTIFELKRGAAGEEHYINYFVIPKALQSWKYYKLNENSVTLA